MLLEGEINGAGAADLVRLFVAITNPAEIFHYVPKFADTPAAKENFSPQNSVIRLATQFGGITTMELESDFGRIVVELNDDRSKPSYSRYFSINAEGKEVKYSIQSYNDIRAKCRDDLLPVVERACW